MPDIKLSSLYMVLGFIVPGLIATFVRAQFITGRTAPHAEALLSYLVLSITYYALTLPAVDSVVSDSSGGYSKFFYWFALVFIGPAALGLALGIAAQREWGRRFLIWCCLNPVHVMPTAWDWKFGGMQEQWVLATLKDGTRFAGFCGRKSFVSSDPKERDLYIERIYEIDNDNVWQDRGENGVLITHGEIRTIEFWPYRQGVTNDRQR